LFLFTSVGYFNFLTNTSLPFTSLLSPSVRRTGYHFPNSLSEAMRVAGESPYLPSDSWFKLVYMPMELILNKKKRMCPPRLSSI
jgi:hypothetical protein